MQCVPVLGSDQVMFHVTDSGSSWHVLLPLPTLVASLRDPEAAVAGLPLHPHTPL